MNRYAGFRRHRDLLQWVAPDVLQVRVPPFEEDFGYCSSCGDPLHWENTFAPDAPGSREKRPWMCLGCASWYVEESCRGIPADDQVIYAVQRSTTEHIQTWILYLEDGKLFEVRANEALMSDGIVNRWEPTEATAEDVLRYLSDDSCFSGICTEAKTWIRLHVSEEFALEELAEFLSSGDRDIREAAQLRISSMIR